MLKENEIVCKADRDFYHERQKIPCVKAKLTKKRIDNFMAHLGFLVDDFFSINNKPN